MLYYFTYSKAIKRDTEAELRKEDVKSQHILLPTSANQHQSFQHSERPPPSQHSQHGPPSQRSERPPASNPKDEATRGESTYSKNERRFFGLSSQHSNKEQVPNSKRSEISSKGSYNKDADKFYDNGSLPSR